MISPARGTAATSADPSGRVVKVYSPSRIETFRKCQRIWAFRYISEIKSPDSPASLLGKDVDDNQLQPYLRDNRPIDFSKPSGYIAVEALPYLPKPKTLDLEVQRHFQMPPLVGGNGQYEYQGYIDLWLPRGGHSSYDGTPDVTDFKTKRDLKWALTPEQLATDVQANLYAAWALASTGANAVDLNWINIRTVKPHKVKPVHLRVFREHVEEQVREINKTAEQILALESTSDPLALPANPAMCERYGGCPYRDKCNLSPAERLESLISKHVGESDPRSEVMATGLAALKARREAMLPAEGKPAEIKALGINPPEAQLPLAPPTGSVDIEELTTEVVEDASLEAAKPATKVARPRKDKAKAESLGAPLELYVSKQTEVSVTWAEEAYTPLAYNSFRVGPFTATGAVRDGETATQACERLYGELAAFAEQVRNGKAASFRAALEEMEIK